MAINYLNPYAEVRRRRIAELLQDALIFITPPIPYADTIVKKLYDWAVMKDIRKMRKFEERLVSVLKYRNDHYSHDWSYEIGHLRMQNYNAFELSSHKENLLIERRKKELDI